MIRDEEGKPLECIGYWTDITEQKEREIELKDSEERFRAIFDNAADGILLADIESKKFHAGNKVICQMFGCNPEEITNLSVTDIHPKEDLPYVIETFEKQLKGEITLSRDIPVKRRDGSVFYADINSVPIILTGKKYLMGIFRDITERKNAEEEIKKFKEMAERATFGCAMADLSGNVTYINESFAKMHGYTPAELIGKNLKIFHTDAQMKRVGQLNKRLVETGEGIQGEEVWHVHRDGTEFPTLMSNWVLKESDGNPYLMCGTAVNITDHMRAEDALRESEERLRVALSAAQMGTWRWDPATNQDTRDASFNGILGLEAVESTQPIDDFLQHVHPEDRDMVDAEIQRSLRERRMYMAEFRIVRPDGTVRWLRDQGKPAYDENDHILYLTGAVVDITERKRAEDALRESEKRFRGIFENTAVGVYRTRPDGQILMANPALVQMLGYSSFEELSKRNLEEEGFEPEYERSMFKEDIERKERIVSSESIWITQDGKRLHVIENARAVRDEVGKILYYEGTVENITKRKQTEEELDMYREKMAHAERLASLGTLSATMVHKLNQPLTAIRLSIENSLAELQTISCPSTVIEDIKDGLSAVSDVASTVDSFRNFARKSSKDILGEVNLKAVAERILKLLKESARRAKVTLCLEGMEELPPIFSNEKDLEQLFFALVENAIQAADGNESRRLIISTDIKDECIELRFADDCGGIAPENLDKIFEPFFTTRSASERTGLGLCIVEHIVSGANGKIRVESKTGKGSTFFVTLPLDKGKRS